MHSAAAFHWATRLRSAAATAQRKKSEFGPAKISASRQVMHSQRSPARAMESVLAKPFSSSDVSESVLAERKASSVYRQRFHPALAFRAPLRR